MKFGTRTSTMKLGQAFDNYKYFKSCSWKNNGDLGGVFFCQMNVEYDLAESMVKMIWLSASWCLNLKFDRIERLRWIELYVILPIKMVRWTALAEPGDVRKTILRIIKSQGWKARILFSETYSIIRELKVSPTYNSRRVLTRVLFVPTQY